MIDLTRPFKGVLFKGAIRCAQNWKIMQPENLKKTPNPPRPPSKQNAQTKKRIWNGSSPGKSL